MPRPRPARAALVLLLLLLPATACSRFTKQGADDEVYGILDEVRPCVSEVAGDLDVDAADRVADASRRSVSYRLTLRDALALAASTSREYRRQREDVYLAALVLTGEINDYRPLFGLGAGGDVLARHTTAGGALDGSSVRGALEGTVSRAFETGGGLVLGFLTNFLKNLASSDPFSVAQTLLSADLLVPLARGSGWVARENLTQAEHDTVYAMRSFARYQQSFTVRIASSYYRLLQLRDTWRNEEKAYESLERLLERQASLGAEGAGRIPDFEVDQTRQDLLRADERRLVARIRFAGEVDAFKLQLGIPITVTVGIPEDDLDLLQAEGLRDVPGSERDAIARALDVRLDLANARGREMDAWRKVLVAKNGLGAQVDLSISGSVRTLETRPLDLTDTQVDGLFGLDIDLPLQRTAERNAYRAALIQAARIRRDRQALEDEITLAVRDGYRSLETARRSFEIQEEGVRLAERRVESTGLLLEAGKASTRDRLEAEDARVRARNAVTLALVSHAVARLELARDMGTLQVLQDASWIEFGERADASGSPPASAAPTHTTPPPPPPPPVPPALLPAGLTPPAGP